MNTRPVVGLEGLYSVTDNGQVISHRRKPDKVLKPWLDKHGYLRLMLRKDLKTHFFLLHRLVAIAFVNNPDGLPNINHLNMDKTDNRADNLEWITDRENIRHAMQLGQHPHPSRAVIAHAFPYVNYSQVFCSMREAGRHGFSVSSVSRCCLGKQKSHKNRYWRYLDEFMDEKKPSSPRA